MSMQILQSHAVNHAYSSGTSEESTSKKRTAAEAFHEPKIPASTYQRFPFNGPRVVNFAEKDVTSESELSRRPVRESLKIRAASLSPQRKALPIYQHAENIRQSLIDHDVLLLAGETGSGKSTQVPQFLLDEPWCKATSVLVPSASGNRTQLKVGGCIAITQPRRVAAISLARRVAEEMGSPLGNASPASKVGYSVRFDNCTSPSTRIKFLTEGMLLQDMLKDPHLRDYSAVIVDEVHERGTNVDLILGFLQRLRETGLAGRGQCAIKIVVMSATADMEALKNFFSSKDEPSGVSVTVATSKQRDTEWSGFSDDEVAPTLDDKIHLQKHGRAPHGSTASLSIKGRQYPVHTTYSTEEITDWVETAFQKIIEIHMHQPLPGDILVFGTGQETVETLQNLCSDFAVSLRPSKESRKFPKLLPLPLFAALPQQAQQRVFDPAPAGVRKVILATNIAETSVTVPGVRFVIDCGKCKKKQFRSQLNLDSLLVKPVSKSSANQRKGRAGREAAGICYRLYTEKDYLDLAPDNDPEILRSDLTQVILVLKARLVRDIQGFPWLTAPRKASMERATLHLLQLGALEAGSGEITLLGKEMATLPLPATLARVLLASAEPQCACVTECIDIISALSVEHVFLNVYSNATEEKREAVEEARRGLYRREGDHLTLLATVQAYVQENTDRKRWCGDRFISHRAMQAVMDVRKQLRAIMDRKMNGRATAVNAQRSDNPREHETLSLPTRILEAFLAGFGGNTASLAPDGTYKTLMGHQTIVIHPSSVLFGRKVEAILYNEFVYTQRAYARNVSAIELKWLDA